MFDSELYDISEKAFKRIDKEKIQEKKQKLEKEVLKIIKMHSPYINDDGIVEISYNQKRGEYFILDSIISSHMQKYFEDEYSLYCVDKKFVPYENGDGNYYKLTFIWNSIEYNIKNMPQAKSR